VFSKNFLWFHQAWGAAILSRQKVIAFSLILFLFSGSCVDAETPAAGLPCTRTACPARVQGLTVAAAANLQPVLEALQGAFEKGSGVKLRMVTGSSGKLTAQIENGAPFDVFVSADTKYPEALYKKGLSSQPPRIYAYGILVLWSMKDWDLSKGIFVLQDARIKKIAVANPEVSPYGREAVKAMEYYKMDEKLAQKLVFGESIGQTNDFIVSQSADIGFTSKSTVVSPSLKEKGVWVQVPAESYQRIAQGAMMLRYAERHHPEAASEFYHFLFSPEAKAIFKKYGYTTDE